MDGTQPKNHKKALIAGVIVIIVIVAALGVIELHRPAQKQNLVIMVDSGSMTGSYLKAVGTSFEKSHPNVNVEIDSVGYSDMVTTATSTLKGGSSTPSIFMYYASQSPDLAPLLYNLNSTMGRQYLSASNFVAGDLASGSFAPNGTGSGTNFIGVPIHTVLGYILVYNKTVFENTTLQNGFYSTYHFHMNPKDLKNWTQMNEVAKYISENTNFNGNNNKYAFMVPDSSSHSIIDMYYNLFYPYGVGKSATGIPANSSANYWTYFGINNSKVSISYNNTYGVQALKMYKNITQYEPSVSTQPIGYDQQELYFGTGDYAMGLAWSSFIPTYENSSSKVKNDLGVALLPGNYTGYSPTFLGVNPHAQNLTLVLQFLKYATSSSEFDMGIKDYAYVPSTYTGLNEASHLANFTWLSSLNNYSKTIKLDTNYTEIFLKASPLFSTLIPDFNSQVYDYLTGSQPSAITALNTAAKEWASELKDQNIQL